MLDGHLDGLFSELLRRSLPHELVRRTQDIAIHLVTREAEAPAKSPWLRLPKNLAIVPLHFLYATLAVAAALAVGEALTKITPIPNLSIVFLLAVLVTAMSFGIWPAIYASVLSFFVYNFFFIPPLYTFTVAEPYELLALVIFLVVAVISSALAGRVREQARISGSRMRAMRRLYEFTRRLSGLATLDAVAEGAASEIHASLGRPVVVLLARDDDVALIAAWPPEDSLDAAAMTAARWAYSHVEPAGTDTGTLPIIPWYFVPLRTGTQTLGVVGVAKEKDAPPLDSEARALLDTLVEQTAAALERASLAREMVSAKTADRDRARTQYFAGVCLARFSHSAVFHTWFGHQPHRLRRPTRRGSEERILLGQIKKEAEDLDEMVRNLLAITRIDAGALELRRDWIDLREVAERVVSAARRHGARQRIEINLPADLPLVRADATLAEQAIGNVVANAIVHTPSETHVLLDANVAPHSVALRVTDDGPGIPSDGLAYVFEKFAKGGEPEGRGPDGGPGTGLGLAIAKGIMEAHGGAIKGESPAENGRGARFIMTFPREEPPA